MKKQNYSDIRNLGIEIFALLIIFIILLETTSFEIEYYLSLGIVSLLGSSLLTYFSYKTIKRRSSRRILYSLFFASMLAIIISNLFPFDALLRYHPLFYSLLLPVIVAFPLLIKKGYFREETSGSDNMKKPWFKRKKVVQGFIALALVVIVILSFYLRIYNADIISPGRDSLHHYIAAKSINDNGSTVYETLPYINHMLAFIFRALGESLVLARLPFIFAGALSVFLIYFIGRKISISVGIISALLFAIAPWAIGLSRYVRGYSFNILFEIALIVVLLYFPKSIKSRKGIIKFAILNFLIYTSLIIFAFYQEGLVISIIIALLITTAIRVFAELNLYERIKSLKINSKETSIMINVAILGLFIAILAIYVLGFDNRLTLTYQPKWLFFFLTESRIPMLWYSFLHIPPYFIFALTLIPLIVLPRNRYVWTSFIIFYSYLAFFLFIAKPHTPHLYARYIYTAFPFFTILLATSISYIISASTIIAKSRKAKALSLIITLIFLGSVFSLKNTALAADARFSTEDSERLIISVPYRDYSELISMLKSNNFSKDEIVIASELRMKDTIAWYFDFDFYESKNITSFNTLTYDIADNIYLLNEHSDDVISKHESGWIIRRDGDPFPKSISTDSREEVEAVDELKALGVEIDYLGKYSNKYEVYIWHKND